MNRFAWIACALLAGCGREVTAPAQHFLETVVLQPETARAGTQVAVQVTITNITDQPQTYNQGVCVPFTARDSTGADVTPGALCADDLNPVRTLGPHEQAQYTMGWWTFVNAFTTNDIPPLPAGTYMVSGAIQGSDIVIVPVALYLTP